MSTALTRISLTRGLFAIVDSDDFERVAKFKWQAGFVMGRFRAQTWTRIDGRQKTILMHRLVACAPAGMVVDHINGNTLDNRKANLRVCSQGLNAKNRRASSRSYKGVTKKGSSFIAQIAPGSAHRTPPRWWRLPMSSRHSQLDDLLTEAERLEEDFARLIEYARTHIHV